VDGKSKALSMLGEGAGGIWPQDVGVGLKGDWVGGFGKAICISCGFLWLLVVSCALGVPYAEQTHWLRFMTWRHLFGYACRNKLKFRLR
jgi:hypothetical protein